jgi:citrate lyase synthetase
MKELLPANVISFEEIPRLSEISAGKVRDHIASGEYGKIREMVPESTYEVIQSKTQ